MLCMWCLLHVKLLKKMLLEERGKKDYLPFFSDSKRYGFINNLPFMFQPPVLKKNMILRGETFRVKSCVWTLCSTFYATPSTHTLQSRRED